MTMTLEEANANLRARVEERLANTQPEEHDPAASCCEGRKFYGHSGAEIPTAAEVVERFNPTHPTSQAFCELCDALKTMHARKSSDYGSERDPLANIRNGAQFVGIEPWRATLVRLSDKVTRLSTYCRTGSLECETFEDTCFDLASYALLTLLTHREAQ